MENQEEKDRQEDIASYRRTKNWNTAFLLIIGAIILYNLWVILHFFSQLNPLLPSYVSYIVLDEEINLSFVLCCGLLIALLLRIRGYYAISSVILAFALFIGYISRESLGFNELFIPH